MGGLRQGASLMAELMDTEFQPISKADSAYERLRHEIRAGSLKPNERVTLHRLSDMLGMSLTPVREALHRLESEGFVIHQPHRGTFIAEFNTQHLDQIYRLRGTLEPMAVRIAAERVAHGNVGKEIEHIKRLRQLCDDASSPADIAQFNAGFHQAIYALSDDPMLVNFIEKLWAGVPYQSLSLDGNLERIQESSYEHQRIYEALAAGDGVNAAEQMRLHIQSGYEVINRVL